MRGQRRLPPAKYLRRARGRAGGPGGFDGQDVSPRRGFLTPIFIQLGAGAMRL